LIFLDSSYFIALAIDKDQWHKNIPQIHDQIEKQEQITSLLTLSESLNIVGSLKGGKAGKLLYEYITKTNKIIHPTENTSLNAIGKFLKYNGTLSYADVVSLEIMEEKGINTIVSFDSDFDKVKGIKRIH
jgi:predicted nucleic acid-binding protein